MRIEIPEGSYIKKIDVSGSSLEVDFAEKKKVALLFISLNDRYWPYLNQVVKDCKQNFLPQHKVDYFVWTDCNEENRQRQFKGVDDLLSQWETASEPEKKDKANPIFSAFAEVVRLYNYFYPKEIAGTVKLLSDQGIFFRQEGSKYWIESSREMTPSDVTLFSTLTKEILTHAQEDTKRTLEGSTINDVDGIEWPGPTLMRYHLFLQQEEKLKDYDYIFYMDADMRVVATIGDEIMGNGLTAAEHPMYSLRKEYIPPYEPNKDSAAYISRPGKLITKDGKSRFQPYYYAGGFQGGTTKEFIESMHVMKEGIDKDFNNNYTAIWNDESHWNKYLADKEPAIVLSPAYVYPDSLIKEYYESTWGCSYEPKIVTLTKPFSLSAQGAEEINKFIKGK